MLCNCEKQGYYSVQGFLRTLTKKEVITVSTVKNVLRSVVGSKIILGVMMLGLAPLFILSDQAAVIMIIILLFLSMSEIGWLRYSMIKARSAALPLAMIVLILGGFTSLGWVRLDVMGGEWLVTIILAGVVATDTAAMLRGKYLEDNGLEGTRLFPKTSPNKTLEGVVSGVIAGSGAGLVAWGLCSALGLLSVSLVAQVALILATPPLAIAGDYLASAFKRSVGVKDFSRVLGAHGGVLDRIDGHLMAFSGCAVLLYLLM